MKRGNELVDLAQFREKIEIASNHMTQTKLEEKAGIKNGGLSRIYAGVDALTVDHLIKLSEACNCSIDYLLGRDTSSVKKNISISDVINTVHSLYEMGSIKLVDNYEWTDPNWIYDVPVNIKIKSLAIVIANNKLQGVLNNYSQLRKGMDVLPDKLRNQVYSGWLNIQIENKIITSNSSIAGDDLADKIVEATEMAEHDL